MWLWNVSRSICHWTFMTLIHERFACRARGGALRCRTWSWWRRVLPCQTDSWKGSFAICYPFWRRWAISWCSSITTLLCRKESSLAQQAGNNMRRIADDCNAKAGKTSKARLRKVVEASALNYHLSLGISSGPFAWYWQWFLRRIWCHRGTWRVCGAVSCRWQGLTTCNYRMKIPDSRKLLGFNL